MECLRIRASFVLGTAVLALWGGPAAAQFPALTGQSGRNVQPITREDPVTFTADEVAYDRDNAIVSASGNVEAWQNDNVLRADRITFDRNTNVAAASGNVVLVGADGQVLFSDYAELTEGLRDGVLRGMRALLAENGFNVAQALVGSEGTCVVVLEATLRLLDNPRARSLLVLGYEDVYCAGDHVMEVMECGPIALEGMDDRLIEDMSTVHLHPGYQRLLPEGRGWLLVEFGGNDGLRGIPLADTQRNLSTIVSTLLHAGAKVVVAGITLPPNYGPDYVKQFNQIFTAVAAENRVPIIPNIYEHVYAVPNAIQDDGIHPTAKGAQLVADEFIPVLKPLLHK